MLMSDPSRPYTYLEIVCEAKLNSTEKQETLVNILHKFIDGEITVDSRYDGTFLLVRSSNIETLQLLGEWIRQQNLLDTVRERLIRSITGNVTALYCNRQAAAMSRLALVDIQDNPPCGPIIFQLVSDNLMDIIDQFTPRTWKGKELTKGQWEKVSAKIQKKKDMKRQDKIRRSTIQKKYDDSTSME